MTRGRQRDRENAGRDVVKDAGGDVRCPPGLRVILVPLHQLSSEASKGSRPPMRDMQVQGGADEQGEMRTRTRTRTSCCSTQRVAAVSPHCSSLSHCAFTVAQHFNHSIDCVQCGPLATVRLSSALRLSQPCCC